MYMKKRTKVILGIVIGVLFLYSLVATSNLGETMNDYEMLLEDYNELQEKYDSLILAASISRPEILPEAEKSEPVPEVKEEKPVAPLGSSRSNPIVVTASQFANEIKSNTDTTKTKYNGKWVQISGKVLSAHNVAGMTSFYLYGEKGGSGLKVVCWVNKEVLKPFDYKGETHTFIGQVREVSTVNSTEIGNCEIIE